MPTAVWTGTLRFGLVTIPVKLYPATQPKDVRFHLVDRKTGERVRYRRFVGTEPQAGSENSEVAEEAAERPSQTTEADAQSEAQGASSEDRTSRGTREVGYDDLVRGYEVEPGQFVTLEPEEIEAVRPSRSRTIDIEHFVDLDRIDPVFFEKSYYLTPQTNAERPYVLLLRAMAQTSLAGIGRFVLRTKPHLVAIRPTDTALGLETLYFSDEVRRAQELLPNLDSIEMSERELDLAEQLIAMLTTDWEPSRYSDDYRNELLQLLSERTAAAIPRPAAEATASSRSGVLEMLEALKASVEAAKRNAAAPATERLRRESGS